MSLFLVLELFDLANKSLLLLELELETVALRPDNLGFPPFPFLPDFDAVVADLVDFVDLTDFDDLLDETEESVSVSSFAAAAAFLLSLRLVAVVAEVTDLRPPAAAAALPFPLLLFFGTTLFTCISTCFLTAAACTATAFGRFIGTCCATARC